MHTKATGGCTRKKKLSQQPCIGLEWRCPPKRRCKEGRPPIAWLLSPPRSTHSPQGPGATPCPRVRDLPATICGPVSARCRLGLERLDTKVGQRDPLGRVSALHMHCPGRCRHQTTHQRDIYAKCIREIKIKRSHYVALKIIRAKSHNGFRSLFVCQ